MKNTAPLKNKFQKSKWPCPAKSKPIFIPIKHQSLIAIRESALELETQSTLESFPFSISIPKIYTIISQNKEISFSQNLSTHKRLFVNFESLKWSELYFNFFKSMLSLKTNQFVFSKMMFQLDSKIALYKTAVSQIRLFLTRSHEPNSALTPLQRNQAQTKLLKWILDLDQNGELLIIFLFDLLLTAIDKENFSLLEGFVIRNEAVLLLNHFVEKKLIILIDQKIQFESESMQLALKTYKHHQGRFCIGTKHLSTLNLALVSIKESFSGIESILQKKKFNSCFFHT